MPDEPGPEGGPSTPAMAQPTRTLAPKSWLALDIVDESSLWSRVSDRSGLAVAAASALTSLSALESARPAEACLVLADDALLHDLNSRFRGQDKPTNVLSFPSHDALEGAAGDVGEGDAWLGDVIIAFETLDREARDQNIPFAHHFQHLVVHGLLHLMGYDHETDDQAREMEALEVATLAQLQIPNPYLIEETT